MLKKQQLKSRPVCKVTFRLPRDVEADTVAIVGDFNGWDPSKHQMEQLKSGEYKLIMDLDQDQEYEFRYLVDGDRWYNDQQADRYVTNEFGGENSLIAT